MNILPTANDRYLLHRVPLTFALGFRSFGSLLCRSLALYHLNSPFLFEKKSHLLALVLRIFVLDYKLNA